MFTYRYIQLVRVIKKIYKSKCFVFDAFFSTDWYRYLNNFRNTIKTLKLMFKDDEMPEDISIQEIILQKSSCNRLK
jgi:hypothetical protein